jgi:shikimate kinase
MTDDPVPSRPDPRAALRHRTIVLVGLMGVGKSSVGRRLAAALDLPFRDADNEVEAAAGRSIPEIFAEMGEGAFRDGERRVIARLLEDPPHVLATGGGAFANAETRALIKDKAIAVWLKADLELLARRVSRKEGRPLLKGRDPMAVLREHADARYPAYGEAHLTVETGDTAHGVAVEAVIQALNRHLSSESESQ